EVYERPATAFVAGFVGVSNLVSGPTAQAITGSAQTFTVRPEKIHLCEVGAPVAESECAAPGRIRDVVYLGMHTRYLVELDSGGDPSALPSVAGQVLTVVEQNLRTTSMDVLAARGRPVKLVWERAHNRPVSMEIGN
ncbi:MAG: TOBE domain-containing protein, partial [Chloroflexota bacterium]